MQSILIPSGQRKAAVFPCPFHVPTAMSLGWLLHMLKVTESHRELKSKREPPNWWRSTWSVKQSFKGSLQSSKSLLYWWPNAHFSRGGPSTHPNLETFLKLLVTIRNWLIRKGCWSSLWSGPYGCFQDLAIRAKQESSHSLFLTVPTWRNQVLLLWCLLKVSAQQVQQSFRAPSAAASDSQVVPTWSPCRCTGKAFVAI